MRGFTAAAVEAEWRRLDAQRRSEAMTNEETAATSIPLHSLLKLLHATKVLGRLEVEVSSGTLTLILALALALALALTSPSP